MKKTAALVIAFAVAGLALFVGPASATMPHSGPKTLVTKRTGGSSFELRSLNPATGATHLLRPGPTFSVFPGQYSPDGKKIAYYSNETGIYQIYIAKSDGSNAHAITSGVAGHWFPTWSPNGKQIAYSHGGDLYVINSDGSNDHQVSPGASIYVQPSWAPNGKHIAFLDRAGGDEDVFSIKPSGSGLVNLTNNTVADDMGDWSPNGKHIIYDEAASPHYEIFSMTPQGTNQHAIITDSAADLYSPVYTADGSHILYTRFFSPVFDVWWAKPDSSHKHQLTSNGTDNVTFIRP